MSWDSKYRESNRSKWTRRLRLTWEFLWKGALTLLIPVLLAAGWYVFQAGKFDINEVKAIPARTVLVDRHDNEYGTVHGANRHIIERADIPDFFVTCLLTREDASFMEHGGVHYRGLLRATLRNAKDLDFTQGASTLTMQLARNTYDLREKKSLNRKFLEIALTYRIESRYDKDEILAHYLNRIYFGSGCSGIEEAAQTYFGHSTSELTQGQSALLAGIIRAPHACSPWRNLEGAIRQRDEVIDRLVVTGAIDQVEADAIKNEDLGLRDPNTKDAESSHAERLMRRPLEVVLDSAQTTLGGLRVLTSLDFALQQKLEKIIAETKLPSGAQMATLALDPTTGDVLATVGCRDKKPVGFNRALDSRRDLGPALMEPFIGTMALERGHIPIPGQPIITGRQLSEQDATQLLGRFGFEGKIGKGDDLYRGSISASLLELARAYATILNKGLRPEPIYIRELQHQEKTVFKRPPENYRAFSEHSQLKEIPPQLSGTSLPRTDYWIATLSPNQVIITWIGYDKPQKFSLSSIVTERLQKQLQALTPR